MAGYGKLAGKVLALLASGVMLGFTKDRKMRRELLEEADKIWLSIDRKTLNQLLKRLKLQGLIAFSDKSNREESIKLTEQGRRRAVAYKFYNLSLKPRKKWDGKWRIVLFDIPEQKKKTRDALRRKLKRLGFLEFQKSVFIYPYPCEDEINFVINFFNIHDMVYYIEAPITPDHNFRAHFKI